MKELSFFDYIRQTGISGAELFVLVVALLLGWMFKGMLHERLRARHMPPTEPVTPVVGLVSAAATALVFGYFAYAMAYSRYQLGYQLRPEASRYVVGEVYRISAIKGRPIYNYSYQAGGQSYQNHRRCDSGGCPPIGTRFFIQYALADRSLSRCTGQPVPDSLAAVPGREWAELP